MPYLFVPKYYRVLNKIALVAMRGLRVAGHGLAVILKPIFQALGLILSIALRFILLPLYSLVVLLRIRLTKIFLSARGVFFFFSTNRYVFHAVLLVISVVTISTQLQTRSATALETGRRSMLYTLVTSGQEEVVEESTVPGHVTKNTNYLGSSTIVALPDIDYDYDQDQPLADMGVPGSIAVQPGSEDFQGNPATPVVIARTQTETYTVQSGDTVAGIAARFGVNVGTIIWTNKLSAKASIKPGETLKIPSVSGVLYAVKKGDTIGKIATLYKVDVTAIQQVNNLGKQEALKIGDELVLPGAIPLPVPVKPKIAVRPNVPKTTIPGKSYDEYQELKTPGADARTKPADEEVIDSPADKLIWPTTQHLINQYYGWRHTGVDINGDYTDPIYAAADGVIEKAGWNAGGYGLMILIDHPSGMKTRYGHASKLFVAAGDTVKKGQVIAMVGTTGRSTGTHLHFEVYNKNGVRSNPLAFIK